MKYLNLLTILFLFSCQINYNLEEHSVDPSAIPHIKKFESLCGVPVNSSVILVDMPIYYFGECSNYSPNNKYNTVRIDRRWWESVDYDSREQLLFHELGHCVLNKRHDNTLINLNGVVNAPKSIMYHFPFGYADVYRNNKEYYYRELCNIIHI